MDRNLIDHFKSIEPNNICSIIIPIVAGVATAGIGAIGSMAAANTAAQGQQNAINAEQQDFNISQQDLQPYNTAGQNAVQNIQGMPNFNFQPTMAQLSSTPGYQFALQQGLLGVQNSAAARGLGNSGAALRGAATYAQGLASNTYQNQFSNALNTYQTNLGRQQALAQLGQAAGAGQASAAIQTGANVGAAYGAQGNDLASGISGATNAFTNQLGISQGLAYSNYLNNQNPFQGIYAPTDNSPAAQSS